MFSRRDKLAIPTADEALPAAERPFAVPERHFVLGTPLEPPFPDGLEQAMFGMGCFWGAERKFWQAAGVYTTAVGYAGGYTPNPTYEEVCSGRTGHTEVVLVVFDPKVRRRTTSCSRIFWESHDPTQGMRQGNDVGTQYRSAIYTFDDAAGGGGRGVARDVPGAARRGGLRRDHDRDPRPRRRSITPRTTTSSTWPRTRAATAASAAPA